MESSTVADAQSFAAANCATLFGAIFPVAAVTTVEMEDVVEEVEDNGVASVDDPVVAAVDVANAAALDVVIRVMLEILEIPVVVGYDAVGVALANAAIRCRCLVRCS